MKEKIFQIDVDYRYSLAEVVESNDEVGILDLSSQTIDLWEKFKYGWLTEESEIKPNCVIVFSELIGGDEHFSKAIQERFPLLQLKEVNVDNDKYRFIVAVPVLKGCINIRKSKVTRFSTGDIMEISNPVFFPGDYPCIFKVEELPSAFFCMESFKDVIDTNQLSGFVFVERKIKSNKWF